MEIMGSGGELSRGNEDRIYVSVRLRPLNDDEISCNDVSDWESINDDTIVYKNASLLASERSMHPTAYTFDRVFGSDCSTREVYEQGAKDVALSVVHGMNSTIFAYGQTNSGKTYTMTGIIDYAIADIYEYIQKHPERDFILKFSAMEIYNESVRDLLNADSTPLRLLDDPERGTMVEKLTEEILTDRNHATQLLSICKAQRQIEETSLNEMSSRSHQIIRLTIESSSHESLGRENVSTLEAAVNFVDLAGSERASQSLSAATRLEEGCHINHSLLTLGTVIRKLSKERNGHIPYRDSKLTRILQSSLGGNARTAIICTISPARSHAEQSRNTLLFASCVKEVTTNAHVNVVMSDKALIKHLQKELARLESELRSSQFNVAPLNYPAILREKDYQIEKLEKDIKDLILQRDIAQAQVKELLRMLGEDASSMAQVGWGDYPHLRVQISSDAESQEQETPISPDPQSFDVDIKTYCHGYSRSSSEDHFVKVPYFDENFLNNTACPRILMSSSNSSERGPYHVWEEIEKQSNGAFEKKVSCIEAEDLSYRGAIGSNYASLEYNAEFPALKVHINREEQYMEFASCPVVTDLGFTSSPLKDDNEGREDMASGVVASKEVEELISASMIEDKESISTMLKEENDFSSIGYLDIASFENISMTDHLTKDSFGSRSLNLDRSRSCKESNITISASPWLKMMEYSNNTLSFGSERESEAGEGGKIYTLNFGPCVKKLSRTDFQFPIEDALDIEIDTPAVNFSTVEDGGGSSSDLIEKAELATEQETTINSGNGMEISPKVNESTEKDVKDIGLNPIEYEYKGLTSWPVEFKRLRREIIKLWHACDISLAHRTYFFLLFQGDPSDAIYLEIEMRRMKFLKDKFSRGEKATVNGKRLTLSSSAKSLRRERRMLTEQMSKKFSEQERDYLFLEWGIGLNTKLRRQQLANLVWTQTEDINHIANSAFLVAKLVGFIEPGQAPKKEIFGLNFAPKGSIRVCSFKRSLVSLF
ncbi:Kinesin-like protein KIN-7F [Sesamum alatum]|uniref:Kinesin-like protein KIN-7F n=1 Tax=Sesamum alatum TaxID=300844 RepID=A0AAE2CQC1_9LAMI|nr:Kinesin-like protein KIN-7F [Sesamum alatum]